MGPENFEYVRAAVHDPRTVRAMLEDYRAGLSIDAEYDRDTRARADTIACPTLIGWSIQDDLEDLHGDPVAIWSSWISGPVTSARIDSGHHMAEDNPEQLASVITHFRRAVEEFAPPP